MALQPLNTAAASPDTAMFNMIHTIEIPQVLQTQALTTLETLKYTAMPLSWAGWSVGQLVGWLSDELTKYYHHYVVAIGHRDDVEVCVLARSCHIDWVPRDKSQRLGSEAKLFVVDSNYLTKAPVFLTGMTLGVYVKQVDCMVPVVVKRTHIDWDSSYRYYLHGDEENDIDEASLREMVMKVIRY